MDIWSSSVAYLAIALAQAGQLFAEAPLGAILGLLAVPVLLAAVSRRLIAIAGTILLVVAVLVIVTAPALATTTIAIASYLGSLIIALSAIQTRRRHRATQAELAQLKAELNRLLEAETHRLLVELKSIQNGPKLSPNNATAESWRQSNDG
jgi:hypothetical protein